MEAEICYSRSGVVILSVNLVSTMYRLGACMQCVTCALHVQKQIDRKTADMAEIVLRTSNSDRTTLEFGLPLVP